MKTFDDSRTRQMGRKCNECGKIGHKSKPEARTFYDLLGACSARGVQRLDEAFLKKIWPSSLLLMLKCLSKNYFISLFFMELFLQSLAELRVKLHLSVKYRYEENKKLAVSE